MRRGAYEYSRHAAELERGAASMNGITDQSRSVDTDAEHENGDARTADAGSVGLPFYSCASLPSPSYSNDAHVKRKLS